MFGLIKGSTPFPPMALERENSSFRLGGEYGIF